MCVCSITCGEGHHEYKDVWNAPCDGTYVTLISYEREQSNARDAQAAAQSRMARPIYAPAAYQCGVQVVS